MPPKAAKPKTKKELKAEAEAAARAAEEERVRQEEEARRVAEQVEQRRQELLKEYTNKRDAKLGAERRRLAQLLHDMQQQRAARSAEVASVTDWEHYLACSPLPDPRDRPAMNDFLNSIMEETDITDLHKTMQQCEACLQLAQQCLRLAAEEGMTGSLQEALSVFATGSADPASAAGTASVSATDASTEPAHEHTATDAVHSSSSPANEAISADATTGLAEELDEAVHEDTGTTTAAAASPAAAAAAPAPPAVTVWNVAESAAVTSACASRAAQHQQDAAALYDKIKRIMDAATAHILHRADEYADPKGDVLLTAQQGLLQWGLWVNTQKNPRFKLVELSGLGMTVEIPKQLALANIALRVQRHPFYTSSQSSTVAATPGQQPAAAGSCLAPLGGVLQVELLGLPPPPKHGKSWTIRQVSPQSISISTIPYPIPPVGADPNTWHPDEEPPPLHFSLKLQERLLVPAAVRVGWWDTNTHAWSEEGISNVSYDAAAGRLSFSSRHLGCLALLHDTSAHLPYSSWTVRPTGGLGGSTAAIDLQVPGLASNETSDSSSSNGSSSGSTVSLEVGSGWVQLRGPSLPQLAHVLSKPMAPWDLLQACQACGLHLTPGSKECRALGLPEKEAAAEPAMCVDLAALCTKFLVASSRWNKAVGPDVLLVRLSEVTDWEEGGRTSSQAAQRIFSKEAADGPHQVLIARREGPLGVSWAAGADSQATPPPALDLSTVEAVQAAMHEEAGSMHASLLHLLAQQQPGTGEQDSLQLQQKDVDACFEGSMIQMLQALNVFQFS